MGDIALDVGGVDPCAVGQHSYRSSSNDGLATPVPVRRFNFLY